MISPATYKRLKKAIARFEQWRAGRTSYYPSEVPKGMQWINNDHRSQVETYEFLTSQPDKYTVYVKRNKTAPDMYDNRITATTWTGQVLGYGYLGTCYYCNGFGGSASVRYPISFTVINGVKYSGTYYVSSGDYAHVKKVKS